MLQESNINLGLIPGITMTKQWASHPHSGNRRKNSRTNYASYKKFYIYISRKENKSLMFSVTVMRVRIQWLGFV